MSWETVSVSKTTCPCGKGTIEIINKMDDWNRHEESAPIIKCNECLKKYKIESKYYCPKPKHDYTIYYCVEIADESNKIKLDL